LSLTLTIQILKRTIRARQYPRAQQTYIGAGRAQLAGRGARERERAGPRLREQGRLSGSCLLEASGVNVDVVALVGLQPAARAASTSELQGPAHRSVGNPHPRMRISGSTFRHGKGGSIGIDIGFNTGVAERSRAERFGIGFE
jgi:hypothetical protein